MDYAAKEQKFNEVKHLPSILDTIDKMMICSTIANTIEKTMLKFENFKGTQTALWDMWRWQISH